MPVPTVRLAALVAVTAVITAVIPLDQPLGMFVVLALVAALAVIDLVLAPSVERLEVQREVPEVMSMGATAVLRWRVLNPTGRAVRVDLADDLAPSLGAPTRRAQARVPARGQVTIETALAPSRRGRFRLSEIVVRAEGPLGLLSRQGSVALPAELRVYPPFRSQDEAELRFRRARILEVGLRSAQGRGGGTEFEQLREYTEDDEERHVDWAATARIGKPIVRTFRAERNQTVLNLIDNGRMMAGQVADVPRVEHAIDAVMMLTYVATRLGDRCGLMMFDQEVRSVVAPGHGRDQVARVTAAMFDLYPELAESDYRGAFQQAVGRFRRRMLIVIHTDLVEQAANASLVPALPLLLRTHVVMIAAARDPEVVAWAATPPTDEAGAYRQAAARATLAERERTAARLRGLGATVIDEVPGELAPRLADAYLRMKATGRL